MQLGLTREILAKRGAGAPPPVLTELRALLALAVPLAAVNLGQVLIGAVDTAVVGRMGEIALGATGLGNSVFFTVMVLGLGIMLGLDPLMSQAVGANEHATARNMLGQGAWLAVMMGVPLSVGVYLLGMQLEHFGIESVSAVETRRYLAARIPSLVPFLAFIGLRSYLQAFSITRPMIIGVVLANVVNLPLSWLLVFGDAGLQPLGLPSLGVEAMGVAGAAWASTASTVIQLGVLIVAAVSSSEHSPHGARSRAVSWRPQRAPLVRALVLGTPIGLQMLAEFGVFSLVNVAMGNIDSRALAGHQVAITLASATFMVPVGVGAAASVRVGNAVGRGDVAGTRRAGWVGIVTGGAFMGIAACAFLSFPETLASVITDKPAVIATAAPLLLVAAVFQLSDGVQAVSAGALRGAGDTRFALWANLAGHYLIGLPLGYVLAFRLGVGASGLWWGLSAGLTCVAIGLALRFARLSRRPIARA